MQDTKNLLAQSYFDRFFSQYGRDDKAMDMAWRSANLFGDMSDSSQHLKNLPMLEGILTKNLTQGSDLINKARTRGTANIQKGTKRALRDTDEQLAQTGLRRAGIGFAAKEKIYGGEADALSNLELGLAEREEAEKKGIISQLLGIDQLRASAKQSDRGFLTNLFGQNEQFRMSNEQLKLQQEPEGFDWGSILASAIQAGGSIIAASDKRIKRNIKYIGKTKKGIPVAFYNYENGIKEIGVIAQDVEEIMPEAVVEIGGIKHVNYGMIG